MAAEILSHQQKTAVTARIRCIDEALTRAYMLKKKTKNAIQTKVKDMKKMALNLRILEMCAHRRKIHFASEF